ncbi:PH domain-containing protein [Branchiibius cervicis]|uniref:PH domain-containing protein n=1 Tax=Branchiibius cervicis TaxID=908252 RepID=A0ABW2AP03_9MICO
MSLVDPRAQRQLGDVLLPTERVVVATHEHWSRWISTIGGILTAIVLTFLIDSLAPANWGGLVNLCWILLYSVIFYAMWQVIARRFDWFVATDKRLILRQGVLFRRTMMMPMGKVTDMSYVRSPLARALGYGTFIMESAGQDQALHRIEWVPQPQEVYKTLCSQIFISHDPEDDPRLQFLSDDPDITNPGVRPPELAPVTVRMRGDREQGNPAARRVPADRFDSTQVPVRRSPDYRPRPAAEPKGSLRQRILRGPQALQKHEFSDEVRAYNVSREDAAPRQEVRNPWWDPSGPDDRD